jgi:hypothetical protein
VDDLVSAMKENELFNSMMSIVCPFDQKQNMWLKIILVFVFRFLNYRMSLLPRSWRRTSYLCCEDPFLEWREDWLSSDSAPSRIWQSMILKEYYDDLLRIRDFCIGSNMTREWDPYLNPKALIHS